MTTMLAPSTTGRPKRQRKSLRDLGWFEKEKNPNVTGLGPVPIDK